MKIYRPIVLAAFSFILSQSHPLARAVEPDPLWEPPPPKCEEVEAQGWVHTANQELEKNTKEGSKLKVAVDPKTYKTRNAEQAKENLKTGFSDGRISPNAVNIAAAVCKKKTGCPKRTACDGSGKNYEVFDASIENWRGDDSGYFVSGRVSMKLSKGACTCPS